MKIQDKSFVAIEYTLSLDSGETIDQSKDTPFGFICGKGQVIPGLEQGLMNREKGEKVQLTIEPANGYGDFKPDMLRDIPKTQFPPQMELQAGMPFEAQSPQGPLRFIIKEVKDDAIVADFNHPLAGKTLHFDITISDVREASPEELSCTPGGACGCESNASGSCGSCGGGCG